MTTTLRDRLSDLAEEAPSARPVPGLWERGLGFRRRRRTGTAVVLAAATVALLVLGSATWLRSPQSAEPRPAGSPVGVPDRLYVPSPWLPGTDDGGVLGVIAALIPADRGGWTGSRENQVVGVSAETGEYRFLDLPGLAPYAGGVHSWALSPDGRYVAYLYRAGTADLPESAATGLALYDAGTGEVRSHPVAGVRGIRSEDLVWAGSGTVVLSYGTISATDDDMSLAQPLLAWDVRASVPRSLGAPRRADDLRAAGPGFVVMSARHGTLVVDTATGEVLRRIGPGLHNGMTEPVFDDTGDRFAIVLGNTLPHPMSVGTLAADGSVGYATATSAPTFAAYGWVDGDHLAVLQRRGPVGDTLDVVVNSIDVRTGEVRRLVSYEGPDLGFDRQLATALLSRPTVAALRPEHPLDPRGVTGGALAIVLAAGGALLWWRRRVRA